MHMVSKAARQRSIVKLIQAGGIASQFDLARELAHQGIETTQATLSRDLGEIGVAKSSGGYQVLDQRQASATPERSSTLASTVRRLVAQVSHGGTTVVIRTEPGQASAMAVEIDRASEDEILKGVLGTIAGDDCIFIACSSTTTARSVKARLAGLVASTQRESVRTRR